MIGSRTDIDSKLPAAQRLQLGYASIDCLTLEQSVEAIMQLADDVSAHMVVTPNSDHIVQLEEDRLLRAVYADAGLVLADGMPIVWASKLLRPGLPERVTGADLLPRVCSQASMTGHSIFLLGAPAGIAAKAAMTLMESYPGLLVAGTYSPPLGFENDPEECRQIVNIINQSGAKIVFVGLGAPKQEYWMHRYRQELKVGVLLGVGAAIEFAAGSISRAPLWMQKLGLEWCYRLIMEPKRLARRYLRDVAIFKVIFQQWRSPGQKFEHQAAGEDDP